MAMGKWTEEHAGASSAPTYPHSGPQPNQLLDLTALLLPSFLYFLQSPLKIWKTCGKPIWKIARRIKHGCYKLGSGFCNAIATFVIVAVSEFRDVERSG
jgi:hypothetical protein